MSNKNNVKATKNKPNKIPWKKKTPLQKGAVITNWLSAALLILWFIGTILKFFKVLPAVITWGHIWALFGIAAIIGFAWFFFVMIMINAFDKR